MKPHLAPIANGLFTLLMLVAIPGLTISQERGTRLALGDGTGLIEVGQQQFDLHSVIVKLMDDGKAEIILVSDITFFLQGTWAE
jgi:hypothetical protein